eukprot:14352590-Alexandrium_andersonii.AAC.1
MRHQCTLRGSARAHGSAGHGGHLPWGHCGTRAHVSNAVQVPNACRPVGSGAFQASNACRPDAG